jgi:hypothetical protein
MPRLPRTNPRSCLDTTPRRTRRPIYKIIIIIILTIYIVIIINTMPCRN